jgi:hypothetical protein
MLGLFVIKNLSIFIVIIVLIVTGCLSEAMPFSLFNVVQILSIPFEETQAEKSTVVFIVLIGTGCLNEVMPFSLFNATQILHSQNKKAERGG